jgi:hypothetical protein
MSKDILIRTKDIAQQLGYELIYADSVCIKKKDCTPTTKIGYEELIDRLSKETGLPISIDYHYKEEDHNAKEPLAEQLA